MNYTLTFSAIALTDIEDHISIRAGSIRNTDWFILLMKKK